jgi:hypothetical protein
MVYKGVEIKPHQILSVIPATRSIVVRTRLLVLHELAHRVHGDLICLRLDSDKDLQTAKFEHIQHIKKHADPSHRVADFECQHPEGGIDFNEMDRLIEMRKTKAEKQAELDTELELMEKMKKAGIEYNGPLSGMMK